MKKIAAILAGLITMVSFGIGTGVQASAEEAETLGKPTEVASLQSEVVQAEVASLQSEVVQAEAASLQSEAVQKEATSLRAGVVEADETVLQTNMEKIKTELESEDTDVLLELNKQLRYYQKLYLGTDDAEEKEKLNGLIETTQDLINDYVQYTDPNQNQTQGSFHLIYSPAVAIVTAYFNSKGYKLAAELLTHAKDNNDLDSIYVPVNKNLICQSSVFTGIANGSSTYGEATFPDEGGKVDKDLYNAIHHCYYSKSSSGRTVVIQDRYDFVKGGYSSIAGVAVSMMAAAQNAGTIVPFVSVCTFDFPDRPAQNQTGTLNMGSNARYTEAQVTLGSGEYKEFETTVSTTGYKVIQTFGNEDTYLYLYDASGNLLASNDDSGYKRNALMNQYLYANTKYKIRVKFYNSLVSGALKLVITPAYGALKDNKTTITCFEDIYNTSSGNFTFNTCATQNYVRLFTYTPSSKKSYTIETESDIDTYLYLIDPRSTYLSKLSTDDPDIPSLYNDDSGTNLNAKITKQLASGIPYMIVYSRYNITTSATADLKLRIH